jgi:hypothetical protein
MNEDVPKAVGDQVAESQRKQAERPPAERERERALIEKIHRQAVEPYRQSPPPPPVEPPTIPCTELPEAKPDSPLYHEWNYYRREVGRLLAEGHEGRFVLIKGEAILGIWDTHAEAKAAALQKYLMQPCLIHQVRSREPLLRLSARLWQCQS